MQCPECDVKLNTIDFEGVEVDQCPSCKGIWFDNDELRRAKDKADPDLQWLDFEIWKHEDRFKVGPTRRLCPECGTPMPAINYDDTNVEVDFCTACRGIWLDGGEFRRIIEHLEQEVNSKSFTEYITSAVQEAADLIRGSESLPSEWKDFKQVLHLLQLRLFIEHPGLSELIRKAQRNIPIR